MARGESMAKTCCQHRQRNGKGAGCSSAGQGGGKTESNQATNKCNKYDDKGSKGSRRHYKKGEWEVEGGRGRRRVGCGKDIGLAAKSQQPQKATSKRLPKNSIT